MNDKPQTLQQAIVYFADKLEEKAKRILQAIDDKQPPACECGYCK